MAVIYVALPKHVPSVVKHEHVHAYTYEQMQATSVPHAITGDDIKAFKVKIENAMQRAPPTIKKEVRELLNKLCCKYCPQDKTGVFLLGADRWSMAEDMIIFMVQDSCLLENINADIITGLRKHMLKYMSSVNETIRSGKRSGHSMQKRLEEAAAWQKVFGKTYKEGGEIAGLSELRSKFGAGSGTSTLAATLLTVAV